MRGIAKFKRIALIYGAIGLAVGGIALPSSWKTFMETYNIKEGSVLFHAKCTVCHTSMKGKALNSYGKDIDALVKETGGKKVTASMLRKVEGLDSSGHGGTNISRIRHDELPGG